MTLAKTARQIYPLILTDRVVSADGTGMLKEWRLVDDLHVRLLPVGYRNCKRPVWIVANRPDHLWVLESVGAALSNSTHVDPKDRDGSGGWHSQMEVYNSEQYIYDAKKVVLEELRLENIDKFLCSKLMSLLDRVPTSEPFSKRWEVKALFYAQYAEGCSDYHPAIFNSYVKTDDMKRTDQNRGRQFIEKVILRQKLDCYDEPEPKIALELFHKYINAVFPVVIPQQFEQAKIKIKKSISVSGRGGRVTKKREKSMHGTTKRPFDSTPLAQVFARLPDGARS